MSTESKTVRFAFGWWDEIGVWRHNPKLKMTADEQFQHNVRHGYIEVPK